MNWLTVKQAAERLTVSEDVILAHIRGGRLRAKNVSAGLRRARYRIAGEWLEAFMHSETTAPAPVKARKPKLKTIEFF